MSSIGIAFIILHKMYYFPSIRIHSSLPRCDAQHEGPITCGLQPNIPPIFQGHALQYRLSCRQSQLITSVRSHCRGSPGAPSPTCVDTIEVAPAHHQCSFTQQRQPRHTNTNMCSHYRGSPGAPCTNVRSHNRGSPGSPKVD